MLGARRIWLKVHLYLGLFGGGLLALIGLTGAVLVFSDEIDRALNPQLVAGALDAPAIDADAVARIVVGRTGQRPYMIELPTPSRPHYLAFVDVENAAEPRSLIVARDTGEVLTDRQWGGFFVSFVRKLHTQLLLGDAGHYVSAALGLLGLVSLGTGLYLWWPRVGGFRKALAVRWHRHPTAFNYELHRVSGFYLLLLLSIMLLSGTYLAMPAPFTAAASVFARVTPYPEAVPSHVPATNATPMTLAEAEQRLLHYRPGAIVTGIYVPRRFDEAFAIYYRGPDEPRSDFGRSVLWIDQYDGRVLQAHEYVRASAADRFFALQILLHNGELAGAAGRWIVLATGLSLPVLFGTGTYVWWVRRRPRRCADGA